MRKLGSVTQGSDEQIAYAINFTAWGTPTSPAVTLIDLVDNSDQSSTKLVGSPSIIGATVTTPVVKSLAVGHQYRLVIKATIGGNVLSAYIEVTGE
jgi:hypothetical protein